MEFRNQLIHNIQIDSLVKATAKCGKSKFILNIKPDLRMAYDASINAEEKESFLIIAFDAFFDKLYKELKDLVEQVRDEIKNYEEMRRKMEEREFLKTFNMLFIIAVDEFSNEFDQMVSTDSETERYKGLIKNGMLVHLKRQLDFFNEHNEKGTL